MASPQEEPEIRVSPTEQNKDNVEMAALLHRIEQLENLTGLPSKGESLTTLEMARNWLINTINIKLHLLGSPWVATVIATLVLVANVIFIVTFSMWQRRQCIATTSIIEGDFSPKAYQEFFHKDAIGTWGQEIFICHTQSLLTGQILDLNEDDLIQAKEDPNDDRIITDDGLLIWTSPLYKACTLPGFDFTDYDIDNTVCPPITTFGYNANEYNYSHGCNTYDDDIQLPNYDDDDMGAYHLKCPNGRPQEICVGLVSIVYYTCPLLATAVGASLGYVAIVEGFVVACAILVYMAVTGKRYTYQDFFETVLPIEEADAITEEET